MFFSHCGPFEYSCTGELHQKATCYVYVFPLRNTVLKLPTGCVERYVPVEPKDSAMGAGSHWLRSNSSHLALCGSAFPFHCFQERERSWCEQVPAFNTPTFPIQKHFPKHASSKVPTICTDKATFQHFLLIFCTVAARMALWVLLQKVIFAEGLQILIH